MKSKISNTIAVFLYYGIILFLSYTSFNKFQNIKSFQMNLTKTDIFPQKIIPLFSYSILLIEFIIVLVLIFYRKIGIRVVGIMFLIFTIYISFLQALGKYEICGCGGVLNGLSYKNHLIINISLIIVTLFIIINLKDNEN